MSNFEAAKDRALSKAADAKREADQYHQLRQKAVAKATRYLRALDRLEAFA